MNYYYNEEDSVLVFHLGIGLIGSSIARSILNSHSYQMFYVKTHWDDSNNIFKHIKNVITNFKKVNLNEIVIIWSAGAMGFNSQEDECLKEQYLFKNIFSSVQGYLETQGLLDRFRLIHFSSGGGLFESQININYKTTYSILRPYGETKRNQEIYLTHLFKSSSVTILRPSSVYSISNNKNRMGLIATIYVNCINNAVTSIYGSPNTLRDYILDDDIGLYTVLTLKNKPKYPSHQLTNVFSGRSYSIYEIKNLIENIIRRKVYIKFQIEQSNSKDITFDIVTKPKDLRITPLETAIRKMKYFLQ